MIWAREYLAMTGGESKDTYLTVNNLQIIAKIARPCHVV